MDNDTHYFRLGLFVLAGIALLLAGVALLGAATFSQLTDDITSIVSALRQADVEQIVGHADQLIVSARASAKRVEGILADPSIDGTVSNLSDTAASAKGVMESDELKGALRDVA